MAQEPNSKQSYVELEQHQTTVLGIETAYYDVGEGPLVVLVHGFGANKEFWLYTIEALMTKHRVITPDLPGHGYTKGKAQPYSLSFYMEWLTALLEELDVEPPFVLVGSSLGSSISIAYALKHPEHVERLAVSNAVGVSRTIPWQSTGTLLKRLPHAFALILTGRFDPHLYRYLDGQVIRDPTGPHRDVIDKMASANLNNGIWPYLAGFLVLIKDFLPKRKRHSFSESFGALKKPTLIVWGKHDGLLPVNSAYEAQQTLPQAELHVFEDSAHAPMVDEPEKFNKALLEFINTD